MSDVESIHSGRRRPQRLKTVFPLSSRPVYFVTAVTWQRQRILASKDVTAACVQHALKQQALGVAVGRYVVMPDHLHFFIAIGSRATLSESVKHLKQVITKAIRRSQPSLRIWQPGFFDHLLRSDESYAEKWNYVRSNPVRAGLAGNAEEWPHQGEVVVIDRA